MNIKRQILILALIFFCSFKLISQAFEFSQFNSVNMLINPGNTGNHKYDWNFYNVLCNKHLIIDEVFKTIYVGGDYQFYIFPDKISVGAYLIHDKLVNSPLSTNKYFFSFSYHKQINNHTIHIGIQPGFVVKSLNFAELTFPDQYDRNTGGFNNKLTTNENPDNENLLYFDFNSGIVWEMQIMNIKNEVGFSCSHLNRPNESFYENKNQLNIDKTIYLKQKYLLEESIFIPQIIIFNNKELTEYNVGALFIKGIRKKSYFIKSYSLGTYYRIRNNTYQNSFVIQSGISYYRLNLNLSYNFPIAVRNAKYGVIKSFEISLIFNGFNAQLDNIKIPCEIY
ncbi:MAG: PorP/SprF family type IX secretion system membrane protein [Bacteroidales bacterium]|nr:PorP/SprF family type IX secretion system membrane protein [Bacteroidales bacterium]